MELDILLKSGTLLLGVIGAGKLLYDLWIIKHSRMRDEYTFAKTFFHEVSTNPTSHPFLREKGYEAIAGDRQLSADTIEYLLSLENPIVRSEITSLDARTLNTSLNRVIFKLSLGSDIKINGLENDESSYILDCT